MEPIISIENISKRYEINHQRGGYVAMRDVLANIARHPLEAAKYRFGVMTGKITKEDFWALKNVSFDVNPGEAMGVIGSNGSGKSTLLKILSKITPPTSGKITVRGKVSSLLEVGTGFHPELSGRENIFLNGAILGMPQKEIKEKFDAIVDFSGIEQFIDTPVKRYSSGMYVRLAFAVAAHLEPDILLVDEVLAVGDAAFQKKCLGKMGQITKNEGRTVLFVSHNLGAIAGLCGRCILLGHGRKVKEGKVGEVLDYYLNSGVKGDSGAKFARDLRKEIGIVSVEILSANGNPTSQVNFQDPFSIKIIIAAKKDTEAVIGVGVRDNNGNVVTTIHTNEIGESAVTDLRIIRKGRNTFLLTFEDNMLRPGGYSVNVSVFSRKLSINYDIKENCITFQNLSHSFTGGITFDERQSGLFFSRNIKWRRTI